MTVQRIGYGRVSTQDQSLEAQKDALSRASVDQIFLESISGTKKDRPEFNKLMSVLRKGDTLVVTRLDRLARSAKDLFAISSQLEEMGVGLEVIEQSIDTSTPEGRLFFTLVAGFAEFEHSMMAARTRDGLAAARARGRLGGRPQKLTGLQIREIRNLYKDGKLTVAEIGELFGVTRATVYRYVKSAD